MRPCNLFPNSRLQFLIGEVNVEELTSYTCHAGLVQNGSQSLEMKDIDLYRISRADQSVSFSYSQFLVRNKCEAFRSIHNRPIQIMAEFFQNFSEIFLTSRKINCHKIRSVILRAYCVFPTVLSPKGMTGIDIGVTSIVQDLKCQTLSSCRTFRPINQPMPSFITSVFHLRFSTNIERVDSGAAICLCSVELISLRITGLR